MKARVCTGEVSAHLGKQVSMKGHVHSVRNLGKLCFINLRDNFGIVQLVVEDAGLLDQVTALELETPVTVAGTVESGRNGIFELKLLDLERHSIPCEPPPVEISKDQKMDKLSTRALFDNRPLTLRNPRVKAIFKLEAEITAAFREFLTNQGFTEIHSPKIVATGTEGGAQLFALDYFGTRAYLAQSPQFYKQIMVGVFERVFETAAVYRAEEHDTTRHLNEYISLDYEMGFVESESDIMDMQVSLLRHIFSRLSERCSHIFEMYGTQIPEIGEIPRVELAEAVGILKSKYGWRPSEGSHDLDPEGERILCEHFHREMGSELVYLTGYPASVRPFYTMPRDEENVEVVNRKTKSFDLLFRGLEITTGGQRIHGHEQLENAIASRGLNPEDFKEYLQCFKHGMPPHGGLAIGLERITKQLLGLKSVKHAALFPRDINRIRP